MHIRFKYHFILGLLFIAACNKDVPYDEEPQEKTYNIEFIESFLLDIAEPSGLSWALNHKDLMVVDDFTNRVFIINVDGKKLHLFPYIGNDTEGITIDDSNAKIWIAEEGLSELIQLDSMGKVISNHKINININSNNKGLEGLSYDSQNKIFYILNEADPGMLIKWQINGGIISEKELHFAQDYSGIFFDDQNQSLWIVSDMSQKLFFCDLDANVKQSFSLDFTKAEGVVVDISRNRLYIVSDSEHKLYTYKITKL